MTRLTLGDRIAAGAVGAVVGALIGLALAWLLGVYSNILGPSQVAVDFKQWVLWSATGLALAGLLIGPPLGTLLGAVISAIFAFENARNHELPGWLVVAVLVVVAFGAWWWLAS